MLADTTNDLAWLGEAPAIAVDANLNSNTTFRIHSLNHRLDLWSANHESGQLGFWRQIIAWSLLNWTPLVTYDILPTCPPLHNLTDLNLGIT